MGEKLHGLHMNHVFSLTARLLGSLTPDRRHVFDLLNNFLLQFRVFCDVAPCSQVEVDRRFRDVYCLHHQGDDGGSKQVLNVSQLQLDYTALHLRRL
jgi:hypothetical protein